MSNLVCPLCKSKDVKLLEGSTDAGGGYNLCQGWCRCGFRYFPNVDHVRTPVGSSGWDDTYAKIRESKRLVLEKLSS